MECLYGGGHKATLDHVMSLKGKCFCIFTVDSGDRLKSAVNYWVDIEIAKYTKYTHAVVTCTNKTLYTILCSYNNF